MRPRRGTTLLELVIVVMVISIIAALAIPRMSSARERATYSSTWASFHAFEKSLYSYWGDFRDLPPDYLQAQAPPMMAPYIQASIWTTPPPIGGNWDWNNSYRPNGSALADWATIGPNMSIERGTDMKVDARFLPFDHTVDDGSLSTGMLRRQRTKHLCYSIVIR